MSTKSQFQRESDFHDQWAIETRIEDVEVEAAFTAPTALENRHIIESLGELKNCTLLDIGCGLGESSVMFAKLGAAVTASDLSLGMLRFTSELARQHGVSLETCLGAGESLPLPAASFDIIYTANTIHHLTDKAAFFKEVQRLLKAGGVFCSWDPVKYNPAINVYRKMATKVRSDDEAPLGRKDVNMLNNYFNSVETRFFWLSTLLLFIKYFLVDRVHPNQDRYWKRIYRENERSLRWWKPFRNLDKLLLRMPLIKWLSWNVVIIARSPKRTNSSIRN